MAAFTDRLLVVIDATSAGAVQELDKLKKGAKDSGDSFDNLGKKVGLAGSTIKTGLVAGAAALVGTGLVSFLKDSADAFVEAQSAAGQFARATNASVEEAGKFTMVAKAFGLEMNDLIEINAEFSRKIKEQPQLLKQLNVEVSKNADGSTNMTRTLVETIDALGQMEDGLKAAQIAAELFGEEGSKQLAGFYLAGIQVADLMERIDFVDQSDSAKKFAASSAELDLAFQQLQITVGAQLVPAMTALIDAGMALGDFLGQVPTSVYLAVGAFVALNRTMAFLRSEMAGTLFVTALDGIAKMAGAFVGVEGAAAKAGVAIKGVGTAMKAALVSAGPFIALFALIEGVMNTLSEGERWQATALSNAGKNLQDQARILRETDSVLDSIIHPDWGANTGDAKRITDSWREMAEATYFAADATNAQKAASGDLLQIINAGNLGTDEGTAAMKAYAAAVGGAAAASEKAAAEQKTLADLIATGGYSQKEFATAVAETGKAQAEQKRIARATEAAMLGWATASEKAAFWQEELNLIIEDGITKGSRFEDVSREAAEAIYKQSENTRIAEEALDRFNFTYSQLIEDLADTEAWGGGVESLKASLDSLDFSQKADEWGDEWKVAAESARGSILSELAKAVEDAPTLDPIKWLEDLKKGAPAEVVKVISGLQTEITNNPLTIPTEVKTPTPEDIRARITDINSTLSQTWNEQVIGPLKDERAGLEESLAVKIPVTVNLSGAEATQTTIAELTAPMSTTLDIASEFTPDGYNSIKAKKDFLGKDVESKLDISTAFSPDGYNALKARKDYLAQNVTGRVTISTVFEPGGYNAVKARKDYLSQDRTATITFRTPGLSAAVQQARALSAGAQQQIVLPPQAPAPTPINLVRVSIDGKQLRAVVRDEVGRVQPEMSGVA